MTCPVCDLNRAVLARAKQTGGECSAAIWMKNRRTGEWYKWDTCTEEPGHDWPHRIWSERDSDYFWHPWTDGDSGSHENPNYGEVLRTEWKTDPSPWTDAEIVLWRTI